MSERQPALQATPAATPQPTESPVTAMRTTDDPESTAGMDAQTLRRSWPNRKAKEVAQRALTRAQAGDACLPAQICYSSWRAFCWG
ncbi:hypothetical protein WJX72_009262 [[Myrmecia] bisecta]|uniref:Uncharacterized protein n=1 Tax=[Myrmecia] bisecta TaxID=41462 RepID=A0AAW1PKQ5_9CHLO